MAELEEIDPLVETAREFYDYVSAAYALREEYDLTDPGGNNFGRLLATGVSRGWLGDLPSGGAVVRTTDRPKA